MTLKLILKGTREGLLEQLIKMYPEWSMVDAKARELVGPRNKREVWDEQGCVLALLASQYNWPAARILEIGAAKGYTAALLKLAAPRASVTTIEPVKANRRTVRRNLASLEIAIRPETSRAWLEVAQRQDLKWDMIFVDGDHDNVAYDFPFWNRLNRNGLFLYHDYSPAYSDRECPMVFDNVNQFTKLLDHPFDVLVEDLSGVGIAGWYRMDTKQVWPPEGVTLQTDGPWPRYAVATSIIVDEGNSE